MCLYRITGCHRSGPLAWIVPGVTAWSCCPFASRGWLAIMHAIPGGGGCCWGVFTGVAALALCDVRSGAADRGCALEAMAAGLAPFIALRFVMQRWRLCLAGYVPRRCGMCRGSRSMFGLLQSAEHRESGPLDQPSLWLGRPPSLPGLVAVASVARVYFARFPSGAHIFSVGWLAGPIRPSASHVVCLVL